MRRILLVLAASVLALAVAALATAPRQLHNTAATVTPGNDLESWLEQREATVHRRTPIVADTEKRIRWANPGDRRITDFAVVYIHGFSATRQEIAPLPEIVAARLGANLFETRLAGHGLQTLALAGVSAEDWLADAAEALAIGGVLGRRIVIIATSTGATLALAMSGREEMKKVTAIVMISPNFSLRDPNAARLTWPGGPQLARLTLGETRSWTPQNDAQARGWSTSYPVAALIEMMRLVQFTNGLLPLDLNADLLTLYSPEDAVVDPVATVEALRRIDAPRNELIEIRESADPSRHVLVGDILSPQSTRPAADLIVSFLELTASR
jgi:alpha-beta hydrolase superfamily lysophospholipase